MWRGPGARPEAGARLGVSNESPEPFRLVSFSDRNFTFPSLVLAVSSEHRHNSSRTDRSTFKAFTWSMSPPRTTALGEIGGPSTLPGSPPTFTSPGEAREATDRSPQPRRNFPRRPSGACKAGRPLGGHPCCARVPFWMAPDSPERRPPPGLRVSTCPRRGAQTRAAERLHSRGARCSPRPFPSRPRPAVPGAHDGEGGLPSAPVWADQGRAAERGRQRSVLSTPVPVRTVPRT